MPTIAVGMTWCAALALGAQVDAPRQYWRSPREFEHLV